jgi:hypothetical protein
MLNETPSASAKLITSLKVAALVTILGTVVLAAEQRWAPVPHEQTIAAQTPASDAQQAAIDYFPARFPAPTGQPAEPMPTF